MAYVNALGLDLVSTGMDTAYRPGESVYDYMARIARQQSDYAKFIEGQKAGAGVSQPSGMGPTPTEKPPAPPKKKPDAMKVLLVGGALLGLAFVMLKKPK
jgi:hypothetical protein